MTSSKPTINDRLKSKGKDFNRIQVARMLCYLENRRVGPVNEEIGRLLATPASKMINRRQYAMLIIGGVQNPQELDISIDLRVPDGCRNE